MRCLACGAEMHLMHVVQDDTVAVRGFERHTHICSACGEVEPRLVFTRPVEPSHTKPVAPFSSIAENARAAARAFFRRAFAKLYDARDKVKQLVVRYGKASRFKEPQSVLIAPHAFGASISTDKFTHQLPLMKQRHSTIVSNGQVRQVPILSDVVLTCAVPPMPNYSTIHVPCVSFESIVSAKQPGPIIVDW